MAIYKVERKPVDETEYYMWGEYDDFETAQKAMKELMHCSGVEDVRIVIVEDN